MFRPLAPAALAVFALIPAAQADGFDVTAMSDAERDAFHAEVRAYILSNPEIIIEAVQLLEERQAATSATDDADLVAANAEAIFEADSDWVGGNPDGDVTLVEFADYRCGFCQRAYGDLMELLDRDDDLRFVVKELPILGPESERAARFAIAVLQEAGDDPYAAVHDALMTHQGGISDDMLLGLSDNMGLDTDAIAARMDSAEVDTVIEENRALAQRLGIQGTPSFVLEERMMRGYLPLDAMEHVIAEVRAD